MIRTASACSLDASHIVKNVWQGSVPPRGPEVARCGFDVLVLCAMEHQYHPREYPRVIVIRTPLDDAILTCKEWSSANVAAVKTAALVRQGAKVLITCHAGRNRSGLVTAIVLHLLTGHRGEDIVRRIQKKRFGALTNPSFVRQLITL